MNHPERRQRERRQEALEEWQLLGRVAMRRRADRLRILAAQQGNWQRIYDQARANISNATRA